MTVRLAQLGEVCEINPRLPRAHGIADNDEVSFVPMAAVSEVSGSIEVRQTRRYVEVKKGYTSFRDGDVLFAKITPCMENGKAALAVDLVGGCGFGSTEFHVLRAGDAVLPEWLRYFVRREAFRREARRNFTGTAGQQRVPASFLANACIPVPTLNEQRRIVDILSRAEGIVRLRREAQQKAAELIPAIFIEMFGDPAANPKGWPMHPLGALADVQGGLQVTKARATCPIERPYLRVANVHRGYLDLSEIKSIRLTESELTRTSLQRGDLLFVEGHGNPNEVGRVAVWDGSIPACTHQNHLIRARPKLNLLLPTYASALLNSESGRQTLLRAGKTTSGLSTISAQNVKDARVMLPPIEQQARFEEHYRAVAGIAKQQLDALNKAITAFQALLSGAFMGDQVTSHTKAGVAPV